MGHTPERHTDAAGRTVKDIRRKTRKKYSTEDNIRIGLAGLRPSQRCKHRLLAKGYDRHLAGGVEALEDRSPKPLRVRNRIPDDMRQQIVEIALDDSDLSPRELALKFTDTKRYFVCEASVYRLLKAHYLITSQHLWSLRLLESSVIKPRPSTRCGN